MLAYAVELTGKVRASFAAISMSWTIPSTSGTSQPRAVQADNIILHYEKGDWEQPAGLYYFDGRP